MTPREAFKVGFLLRCVEEGLSTEDAQLRVKRASWLGDAANAGSRVVSGLAGPVALAAVGLPIVAGVAGGHLAAKAVDDKSDVTEAKTNEILAEYQRLTDQAKRQTALKRLRGLPTLGGLRSA